MCVGTSSVPVLSRGFAGDLDHDASGQGMGAATGALKAAEGRHSSCFQAEKDLGRGMWPAVQHSGHVSGREEDSPLDKHTRPVQRHHRDTGFILIYS